MMPNYIPPLHSWVKITLKEKDSKGNPRTLRGFLERADDEGFSISNNEPAVGGFNDGTLGFWEKVERIDPTDKPGVYEVD